MRERPSLLPEISTLIRDRQRRRGGRDVCLFLGAGADISSGGRTFAEFKRDFFGLVLRQPMSGADDPSIGREVSAFLSRTRAPEIRARLVEASFDIARRRQPSESYLLLALALEKLAVDLVVTTNFDVMLEAAEQSLGLSVLRVYAKGIAMPDDTDLRLREPNRVPYLKLHGCLNGRTITHITDDELSTRPYAVPFRSLLRHRLAAADLVVTGYSGSDPRLAELIATAMKDPGAKVYWCSLGLPAAESPLSEAIGQRRLIHLNGSFQDVVEAIARPVLEAPSHTSAKSIFIPCLFEWRVACAARDYLQNHAYRDHREITNLLVRRRSVERQLGLFLASDKPLAIIAGPSGSGKSALGVRLVESNRNDQSSAFLPMSASSLGVGADFAEHLASLLGGLGSRAPFNFADFELWLRRTGRRLTVYLDALNEHAVGFDHVSSLLRDVARFCYFLPSRSPIRVVVTVRQETWNRLYAREDRARLAALCWSPSGLPAAVNAIQLGPLTAQELEEAIGLLCRSIGRPSNFNDIPPQTVDRLRDPYLLAAVSDEVLRSRHLDVISWIYGPAHRVYDQILRAKLGRNLSEYDADTLATVLARVAFLTVERNEDQFRALDVRALAGDAGRADLLTVFTDLGLLSEADDGRFKFTHERTQEYFLTRALELPECPFSLRTPEGLNRVLKEFESRHQVIAAVRSYFLMEPSARLSLVTDVVSQAVSVADSLGEGRLLAFAKEVMVDLACDNPRDFSAWFERAKGETAALGTRQAILPGQAEAAERHWRGMIQAAAHLPDTVALEVLTKASHIGSSVSQTETEIYATDKVVRLVLGSRNAIDLLRDEPFASHFGDAELPRLRRIGRVLGLVSQVGADNAHPSEYQRVRQIALTACSELWSAQPLTTAELDWFADFIFEERDRYLFNGNLEGMLRFFRNAGRAAFLPILDRLERGDVLVREDIETLRPYISELYQDLEFQLGNFLFILSAANNLRRTQNLWEEYVDTFDDSTPPEMVDFFQAVAIYMYVVNGYPYDNMLERHIDRILSECPSVVEYAPGRRRGHSRGFSDEFDMVFEDGFNPIASYPTLLPSSRRQSLGWHEYSAQLEPPEPLPVFTNHLADALQKGQVSKALRILHALSQFIMLWPREGLWAMLAPIQDQHPVIHRATTRVLAEAYNRYPVETLRFFAQSGVTLSPGDWRDVRARIDPRPGRRQFEGLQWGRVLHFLLSVPGARAQLFQALRIAYSAPDARGAVHGIASALNWT